MPRPDHPVADPPPVIGVSQLPAKAATPELEDLVSADSMRALRRGLKASWASVLLVALLLGWALSASHHWLEIAAWIAGVVLLQRAAFSDFLHPRVTATLREQTQRWLRRILVMATLVGLYWGMSSIYFATPSSPEVQFYFALALGGLAAGSIVVFAFNPKPLVGNLVCLIGPFALWCLAQNDRQHTYIGIGMLLLAGYLMFYGFAHARILQRTIHLRHENERMAAQLAQQSQVLAQSADARSKFFAAASHDLRQPLQALGHYVSLLKPGAHDEPHVRRIEQCVDALEGLLEGVLTISRLDAGKVHRHVQAVDLAALARRLLSLYEGVAASRGLALRLALQGGHRPVGAPREAWALTDPLLFERVLGNLLNNALRYTHRGGVLITLRPRGSHRWQLRVLDTGVGIAADGLERIFEEFVQLDNPQRDAAQGVGLGLATVKRMCFLLEHPLDVRSRLGRGSSFIISLPACPAPSKPERSAGTAGAANTPPTSLAPPLSGHLLLVEDNELVRDALAATLQTWGIACHTCVNGDEALDRWAQHRFDAVLTDWRLPGALNGIALIHRLREDPAAADCAFILMTGEPQDSLGPLPTDVQLLTKPVRPIRLRALLGARLQATHTT